MPGKKKAKGKKGKKGGSKTKASGEPQSRSDPIVPEYLPPPPRQGERVSERWEVLFFMNGFFFPIHLANDKGIQYTLHMYPNMC